MSLISGIWGAEAQKDATEDASAQQAAWQQQLINWEKQKYGDTAYIREMQKGLMPSLLAGVNAPIEPYNAREYYGLASSRGAKDIMSNMATYGLTNSKAAGTALGTMQEGLSAQEAKDSFSMDNMLRQQQISNMMTLMGFPSYNMDMTGATNALNNQSQLMLAGGASQANMWGNIGQTNAQIAPYVWQSMYGKNAGASSAAGAAAGAEYYQGSYA